MSEPRHYGNLFAYKPETWMDSAACVGHPPEWFDAEPGAPLETICAACPVRDLCLEYVMRVESGYSRYGLYGGMSALQRVELGKDAS